MSNKLKSGTFSPISKPDSSGSENNSFICFSNLVNLKKKIKFTIIKRISEIEKINIILSIFYDLSLIS